MSTYQDRVRLVLVSLVTNFAEKDEQGEWWGHDTNLGNQEEAFDQALSELASIVEEEAIQLLRNIKSIEYPPSGKEYHFTDGGWSNNVSSIVRDQLSNRSKSDE